VHKLISYFLHCSLVCRSSQKLGALGPRTLV